MTIECPDCHAELPANASFCSKCGMRISRGPDDPGARDEDGRDAPEGGAAAALRRAADRMSEGENREEELWQGAYSGKSMVGSWISAGLFTLVALVVGVVFAFTGIAIIVALVAVLAAWLWVVCVLFYRRWSVRYTLTTQRFVHETGIFSRRTDRVEVIDIDDVTVKQGFIERFMNVGTIELASSDQTDPALTLRGIDDVKRVAGLIDDARRVERRKRGLHIEQI